MRLYVPIFICSWMSLEIGQPKVENPTMNPSYQVSLFLLKKILYGAANVDTDDRNSPLSLIRKQTRATYHEQNIQPRVIISLRHLFCILILRTLKLLSESFLYSHMYLDYQKAPDAGEVVWQSFKFSTYLPTTYQYYSYK